MKIDYTFQQLRYLVAVAERGSVSAAARSLYVSQPGVSAAVSNLEAMFGIQCFVRHHATGVSLTSNGHSLVVAAKKLLRDAEELHYLADNLNHLDRGCINLGSMAPLGTFFLPQVLEILDAAHPELTLQIRAGEPDSLRCWLRQGTIDAALMYDLDCHSSYARHHLTTLRPYALLSASHRLATQASVISDDLVDEPLILLNCANVSDQLLSVFQGTKKEPRIGHRVSGLGLMHTLVATGKGYSILHVPATFDQTSGGPGVKWIPVSGDARPASVIVASMHGSKSSGKIKALIDALTKATQNFDSEPWESSPALRRIKADRSVVASAQSQHRAALSLGQYAGAGQAQLAGAEAPQLSSLPPPAPDFSRLP